MALGGLALACSLVVGGAPDELRCSQEGALGPPACDAGFRCISGICQAEVPDSPAAGGFGGAEADGESEPAPHAGGTR